MMKRMLGWLLTIMLFAGIFPAAAAQEDISGAYVVIQAMEYDRQGSAVFKQRYMYVIEDGSDLLFSAEDLAAVSGFSCMISSDEIVFARGSKEVAVYPETSQVTLRSAAGDVKAQTAALPSKVQFVDGIYYISGAGMLPRLNVNCMMEDGVLSIIPTPVSIWDFYYDYAGSADQYLFDVEWCSEVMDCTEAEIESAVKNSENLADKVIFSIDADFGSQSEYFKVFERFLLDETAADQAMSHYTSTMDLAKQGAENTEAVVKYMQITLPSTDQKVISEGLEKAGKAVEAGEYLVEFLYYNATFAQDNSQKIKILNSLIECRDEEYDEDMLIGAKQVEQAYSNYWLGLMYKTGYTLLTDWVETFTFESYISSFKKNYLGALPDNELLDHAPCYISLIAAGERGFEKGFDPTSRTSLEDMYAHAMLYLYANEQLYRGMAQYVIDKQGTFDQLGEFKRKAYQIEGMYAKFLAVSSYINNDLFDLSFIDAEAQEYLATFPYVRRVEPFGVAASAAECMILLSAMTESGMYGMEWHIGDIDADGAEELMATYPTYSGFTIAVMDSWTVKETEFNFSIYDNYRYLQTADGKVCLRYDYNDGEEQFTAFFTWSGQKWVNAAMRRNCFWQGAELIWQDQWTVMGIEVAQAEYEAAIESFQTAEMFSFNYAAYEDRSVFCEAESFLSELDEYFSDRNNFVRTLKTDIQGDSRQDRIYLICNAAEMWLDKIALPAEVYGDYSGQYRDRSVLLVVAENGGDHVRLRLQRLYLPYQEATTLAYDSSADGNLLKIGGQPYFYQEYNEPYSTYPMFGGNVLTSLYGMTKEEIKKMLDGYTESNGMAQGWLDDLMIRVYFGDVYGGADSVIGAELMPIYTSPYNVCDLLNWDMDVFDITANINSRYTTATNWSAVQVIEDTDGTLLGKTTCYYLQKSTSNIYLFTLYYLYEQDDPEPLQFYAQLVDAQDVPKAKYEMLMGK